SVSPPWGVAGRTASIRALDLGLGGRRGRPAAARVADAAAISFLASAKASSKIAGGRELGTDSARSRIPSGTCIPDSAALSSALLIASAWKRSEEDRARARTNRPAFSVVCLVESNDVGSSAL